MHTYSFYAFLLLCQFQSARGVVQLRGSFNRNAKDTTLSQMSPVRIHSTPKDFMIGPQPYRGLDGEVANSEDEDANNDQNKYQRKHDGRTWAQDHPNKVKANQAAAAAAAATQKPTPSPIISNKTTATLSPTNSPVQVTSDEENDDDDENDASITNNAKQDEAVNDDYYDDDDFKDDDTQDENQKGGTVEENPAPKNETTESPSTSATLITSAPTYSPSTRSAAPTATVTTAALPSASITTKSTSIPSSIPTKGSSPPTGMPTAEPSVNGAMTYAPTVSSDGDPSDDDTADTENTDNLFKTYLPTPSPSAYHPTPSPSAKWTFYPTKQTVSSSSDSSSDDETGVSEKSKKSEAADGDKILDEIYEVLSPEQIDYLNHHEFVNEEKEAAKISVVYLLITLILMVFTAQQLSEMPDGVYSNICRLAITVAGCVVKMFLLPFTKICGLGSRGYSHHLVTTNDPYNGRNASRMEMV